MYNRVPEGGWGLGPSELFHVADDIWAVHPLDTLIGFLKTYSISSKHIFHKDCKEARKMCVHQTISSHKIMNLPEVLCNL